MLRCCKHNITSQSHSYTYSAISLLFYYKSISVVLDEWNGMGWDGCLMSLKAEKS